MLIPSLNFFFVKNGFYNRLHSEEKLLGRVPRRIPLIRVKKFSVETTDARGRSVESDGEGEHTVCITPTEYPVTSPVVDITTLLRGGVVWRFPRSLVDARRVFHSRHSRFVIANRIGRDAG